MVEISLSGSGEGPGWVTAPGYSTARFLCQPKVEKWVLRAMLHAVGRNPPVIRMSDEQNSVNQGVDLEISPHCGGGSLDSTLK